ncbi:sporulation protein YpjB [Cytobacillus spongiae]|jgi:sporulation protein YpjB|uniref:sporulation protein YpjB n=1 Tax=Cytobacillus spongiae TaxID=2901381 RepID=UPI001F1B73AF|nr:sporulation protein YpjB [Cytobacillus spongiae]UII54622.1 sporulation protein YpjB [Cytobacillus spongiae]
MKVRFAIFVLITILLTPLSGYAEKSSPIDQLDHLSDEALQMVKTQRYEDAKNLLDYFSEQFLTITSNDRPFTMDELRIVTVAHNDAMEAATSANMDYQERINRVTKFRLVMDAISSTHQPLWAEMENSIMTVFGEVKEAAYRGNNQLFHEQFNSFLSLYEVIYPSLKIDVAVEQIQKLDAKINYIDHYRPQVLAEVASQKQLEELEADLQTIFDEMTEDEADPSLWWVIISTGSIIILTLSYVGWRKYRGDREKQRNRSRQFKE